MIDTYITALRKFLADGMSPMEAMDQFDSKEWDALMMQEMRERNTRIMLDLAVTASQEQSNQGSLTQAYDLWGAGWTSENPGGWPSQPMSWYWRRPPVGKRALGRRYLSTNQAWNAWNKEKH